jgi:hypothetical protein
MKPQQNEHIALNSLIENIILNTIVNTKHSKK